MRVTRFDYSRLGDAPGPLLMQAVRENGCALVDDVPPTLEAFEGLSRQLCAEFHDVAIRQTLRVGQGDGYTTSVFEQNFTLLSHAEGRYRPWPPAPDLCFFMCLQAPGSGGGETTLLDGIEMLGALPEKTRRRFEAERVIYESRWSERRWRDEFGVHTREELINLLDSLPGVRYEFQGEALHLFCTVSPIIDSQAGKPAFANGLLTHLPRISHPYYRDRRTYCNPDNRVYWGNGDPVGEETINALLDIQLQLEHRHSWQDREMLILDNTRVMHGRTLATTGGERRILSRFGCL